MKKLLLSMAAIAAVMTSCDTSSGDSYSTLNVGEYNLITDLEDASAPAQVSSSAYAMKLNWSKYCIDMSTSDVVINNQKISFETDTMTLNTKYLVLEGSNDYIGMWTFSHKENIGKGAEVTNLDATITPGVFNVNNLYIPGVNSTTANAGYRLIMGYDLNSRYHVQTFWPLCYYVGKSYVSGTTTYSTNNTAYRVEMDFEKKNARVVVYYPEFSAEDKDVPKAIIFEEIPVLFDHNSYYLEAAAPKTTVLGEKDGVTAVVENEKYKCTDFSFRITSSDLTESSIQYNIDGKSIVFTGCSIIKASK